MKKPLPFAAVLSALIIGLHAQSPTPNPLAGRLDELTPKVAAMKADGAAGQIKAVLTVALERAKASLDAGCAKDADDLLGDVEATLAKSPESLVVPSSNTNSISSLRPPRVVKGNPYIAKLVVGANEDLSRPDKPFLKNTPR